MATTNGIYTAINGIMEEIGAIGKTSKNQQQGFMYRGIDAVMNALQPALVKYKVFVVPEILEQKREERVTGKGGNLIYSVLKIKYTFYAEDGSSVSATVIGEGMDSGDKASNKAMSVAFKYACFQVLCIPTEEMKDPDAETPPESLPKPTPAQLEELQKLNRGLQPFTIRRGASGRPRLMSIWTYERRQQTPLTQQPLQNATITGLTS